ncbi:NGG1p interacting factor 3 family [Pelomyxa schiedti]|nr:NGG1p interacting factor 3 family [Pelomyxa schiedti]
MEYSLFIEMLEKFSPLQLAESWDNVGVIVEPLVSRRKPVKRCLLCIDLTLNVIEEAVTSAVDVVLAYHPVLFSNIKRITPDSGVKQRIVLRAIEAGIAVYCPHTAFDNMENGLNDWIASGLGSGTTKPIKLIPGAPPGTGAGRIHTLNEPIPLGVLLERVKSHFSIPHVRVATERPEKPLKTIAICAGSGSSILSGVDSDAYLTGEMGHHSVLDSCENGVTVILCEHTNTERNFLNTVMQRLSGLTPAVQFLISHTDKEPLSTY